jgi:hypothetical protein
MRNKMFMLGVLVMVLAFGSCGNVGKFLDNPLGRQKSAYEIFEDGANEIAGGKPLQGIWGISTLTGFQAAFEEMFPEVTDTGWTLPSDSRVFINFTYQDKRYTISTTTNGKTTSGEYILDWGGLGYSNASETGPKMLTDGAREILRNGKMNESAFRVAFERQFPEAKINSNLSAPPGFTSSATNSSGKTFSNADFRFSYNNLSWVLHFPVSKTSSATDFILDSARPSGGRPPTSRDIPPPEKIDRVKA